MITVVDMKTGRTVRITVKLWWSEGGPVDNKRYNRDLSWKKKRAPKKKAVKKTVAKTEE